MTNPYKVFHSTCEPLRNHLHFALVRPELGANIGASARALQNMGMMGDFNVVGEASLVDQPCRNLAKNAQAIVNKIQFFQAFKGMAQQRRDRGRSLLIASTARIGSCNRPHPLWVRPAAERACAKLESGDIQDILVVFGPEGSGLTNEEIALCDWVVTIPTLSENRSLNLAQAVLIFAYELNSALLRPQRPFQSTRVSQRQRLITHFLQIAEEVGFILPGDPHKMKPRLEEILAELPNQVPGAKTLHGLADQIIRSVKRGSPDFKGRYKHKITAENLLGQE